MISSIETGAKSAGKLALLVGKRIFLYTSLGIILNWGFFLFQFGGLYSGIEKMVSANVVWIIYSLIVLSITIGFPFIYFLFGKSSGVSESVLFIYRQNKNYLFDLLLTKLLQNHKFNAVADKGLTFMDPAGKFLTKMNDLPGPMKMVYKFLFSKIPLHQTLVEINNTVPLKIENKERIVSLLTEKLNGYIEEKLKPSYSPFIILTVVNILVHSVIFWYIIR